MALLRLVQYGCAGGGTAAGSSHHVFCGRCQSGYYSHRRTEPTLARAGGTRRTIAGAAGPIVNLPPHGPGRPELDSQFGVQPCFVHSLSAPSARSPVSALHLLTSRWKTSKPRWPAATKRCCKVPHGCEGSPTTAVKVRIPQGVIDVKPMPKAGWKLDVVKGKYPAPVDMHGTKMTEGRHRGRLVGRQAAG